MSLILTKNFIWNKKMSNGCGWGCVLGPVEMRRVGHPFTLVGRFGFEAKKEGQLCFRTALCGEDCQ